MRDSVNPVARFVVAAVLCGFLATVLLPGLDPAARVARATPLVPQQQRGRWVYVREGCVACHTQQVRAVEGRFGVVRSQADIGEVSGPAQYAGHTPALAGWLRLGPDLSHVAARTRDPNEVRSLLRSGSAAMPAYRYLSESELADLVAYLLSLR